MTTLLPGRLLRRPGPPRCLSTGAVRIDDARLGAVLATDAPLLELHAGGVHIEGPAWQAAAGRLLFSDVPNRRLSAWYAEDGRVEVVIDATWFMNGNAVAADGSIWHCEHGRRCISRSAPDTAGQPEPVVTHYEGKRLNSPNDVTIAADGAVWFTDPIFGIVMPSQGALAEPELDHRSVYRYDPADGTLARMADFEQPNGIAFSPDGATLYVTDTSVSLAEVPGFTAGDRQDLFAFHVDAAGGLSDRRRLYRADRGYPDGLAVDDRGWLWVSGAKGVTVLDADGGRLGCVAIDGVVSNLCFSPDGHRLFIAASERLLALDLNA
ncbi:SMP-30/gluconolactonase/LRE family protein [Sphingomonas sp. CLY1604]|uniref:SMP-30/gluconolactonase/LRE family protein n=1 Tax=Sphingomonas sp. CLY1604 TaxID=3457786 RepID=UPI003FD7367C